MLEQLQNNDQILAEILLKPSQEIKVDRFSSNNETHADCSGACASGICRGAR